MAGCGKSEARGLYQLAMKNNATETIERLIRVRAERRGKPVELRVHYERATVGGCQTYRLFSVEDAHISTSTN